MKKIVQKTMLVVFFVLLCQSVWAQTHHYSYAFSIDGGKKKVSIWPTFAKEYSITYSGSGFYFSMPNGSPLSSSFIISQTYSNDFWQHYSSNNQCSYIGTIQISQPYPMGQYKMYSISYYSSNYLAGFGTNAGNVDSRVYVSNDNKTLIIGDINGYTVMVYNKVPQRSVLDHVSMSDGSVNNSSISNSGISVGNNNSSTTNYNSGSSKTQSNQTPHDLATKRIDETTYENYATQLMNMCYGYSTYNNNNRLDYQRQMRELRMKWVNKGYQFTQSQWETWNGTCK